MALSIISSVNKMHPPTPEGMVIPALTPPRYHETYIELSNDRMIFLSEDFTKEVSATLTALLLHYDNESQNEPITIYINSNGGDASALSNIYDVMQMIRAPVQTVCLGRAYSAGAFLLAAGTKGKRYIMPHAEVMIHGAQCLFPVMGEEHPINSKNYFDLLTNINTNIMKMLAKHTGHSLEKVRNDCSRDLYLDATAAKKYNLVDEIISGFRPADAE
jgi:ATP-dependent Clp protease, protease subunit